MQTQIYQHSLPIYSLSLTTDIKQKSILLKLCIKVKSYHLTKLNQFAGTLLLKLRIISNVNVGVVRSTKLKKFTVNSSHLISIRKTETNLKSYLLKNINKHSSSHCTYIWNIYHLFLPKVFSMSISFNNLPSNTNIWRRT